MSKKTITGGQSLPFPAKPSGSIAGRTMQESVIMNYGITYGDIFG